MDVRQYLSTIDTNRFGMNVAIVNTYDRPPEDIIAALKQHQVKLVISRINRTQVELIDQLERLRFEIKDAQVTYRYDTGDIDFEKFQFDAAVRDFKKDDEHAMVLIAENAFWNYGHYAADTRLDLKKCNEVYKDWVRRSIHHPDVAEKVLVAEIDHDVAGFLSFKIVSRLQHKIAKGVIGAVEKKYQNNHVFSVLAINGLKWAKDNGFKWIEHNVLVTNYAVNRSLTRIGFKIADSFVTMHLWLEE